MVESKVVIFDFDDTLFLERNFVKSGFNAVSLWVEEKYGVDRKDSFDRLWSLFLTGNRGNIFDLFIVNHSELSIKVVDLVKIYRYHAPQIKPIDGIIDLLISLKDKKIGLISDGLLKVQQAKFKALEIEEYFNSILFSDELGREYWKPSIKPYQNILSSLQSTPEEAVYIGDNPRKDFLSPNKLRMSSIRFRHPEGIYQHLEPESINYAPQKTVYSIDELRKILLDA